MTSAIMTLKNMWNMVRLMDGGKIKGASGGVNQSGVRNYNERLLLSMLQRRGGMAGIDLARMTGLSPQTVSVIFRNSRRLRNHD